MMKILDRYNMSYSLRSIYIKPNADINRLPPKSLRHPFDKGSQISIGDLHGNSLKLIYTLILHGVFSNVSENDYALFLKLYKKNQTDITKQELNWFNAFIKKIKVNQGGTLRLLGDDLADRSSNDYFTLKIFEKLFDNKIPVEVVLSNHTIDFIKAFETQTDYSPNNLAPIFVKSMIGLNQLIQNKLISKDEIDGLVKKAYLPNLKALSYTINEDKKSIALFSHAPIGLDTIESICKKLNIQYKDSNLSELAATIDKINDIFTKDYVNRRQITELLESENEFRMGNIDVNKFPFMHLLWNRNYGALRRPNKHNGYTVKYIHGHDSQEQNVPGHIYNLDNNLGKGDTDLATYNIHYTHEISAAEFRNQKNYTLSAQTNGNQKAKNSSFFKPLLTAIVIGCIASGVAWYFGSAYFILIGMSVGAGALLSNTILGQLFSRKASANKNTDTNHASISSNFEDAFRLVKDNVVTAEHGPQLETHKELVFSKGNTSNSQSSTPDLNGLTVDEQIKLSSHRLN